MRFHVDEIARINRPRRTIVSTDQTPIPVEIFLLRCPCPAPHFVEALERVRHPSDRTRIDAEHPNPMHCSKTSLKQFQMYELGQILRNIESVFFELFLTNTSIFS